MMHTVECFNFRSFPDTITRVETRVKRKGRNKVSCRRLTGSDHEVGVNSERQTSRCKVNEEEHWFETVPFITYDVPSSSRRELGERDEKEGR